MNSLRVVFCGTPQIGADILKALIEMPNVEVAMVISQPDKKVGRKKLLTPTIVKKMALEYGIPIIQPVKISESYEEIKKANPDFIITCAYGQFIPTKILEIPNIDAINIHGSLLPKYRGGAPIQYAIKNGDSKTGISIMKMVKKMDAGDYYIQESVLIEPNDTAGTMFEKLGVLGANMIKKYLFQIANRELVPVAQNETEVTLSRNITTNEEMIDWYQSAKQINNHIRALAPTPIAHTYLKTERYKIKSARLLRSDEFFATTLNVKRPGEIVAMDREGIIIHTNQGFLKVLEIQRSGKTMISAGLYFANRLTDLRVGDVFGELMI
ncbi:methionyl-tRNA formyltransferase [Mesoplasma syrphidae]|uniref:Methionyl-tRNA formyltransferase n=1 Tax=Mesoplasma syrphidae TaxID=225999 RepID=A0A2K9CA89_9MOLU|nr:methionyl-tRNA formyltransferase [Mesoplasma syrphidae]